MKSIAVSNKLNRKQILQDYLHVYIQFHGSRYCLNLPVRLPLMLLLTFTLSKIYSDWDCYNSTELVFYIIVKVSTML